MISVLASSRRGVTVVARADRPPVIGADYVVDQNPEVDGHSNRIFVPYWPQPGVQPRERTDNTIQTVAYFGRVDSFPAEYQSDEFKQRRLNKVLPCVSRSTTGQTTAMSIFV